MLFDEEDLKPSKNYESYQNKLNDEASQYLKKFKDHNSDTVEANLILRQNLSLYKEKYKLRAPLKRIDLIVSEVMKIFPKADKGTLKLYLEKNGFISDRGIIVSLSLVYTFLLIGTLIFVDLTFTHQLLAGIFTYFLGLPTTCLLALEVGNNEKT